MRQKTRNSIALVCVRAASIFYFSDNFHMNIVFQFYFSKRKYSEKKTVRIIMMCSLCRRSALGSEEEMHFQMWCRLWINFFHILLGFVISYRTTETARQKNKIEYIRVQLDLHAIAMHTSQCSFNVAIELTCAVDTICGATDIVSDQIFIGNIWVRKRIQIPWGCLQLWIFHDGNTSNRRGVGDVNLSEFHFWSLKASQ